MNEKTVYVLGAGFSCPMGVPLQDDLFPLVKASERYRTLSDLPEFMEVTFPHTPCPPLEDIFTLLDQTIAEQGYCLKFSHQRLLEVRKELRREILHTIHVSTRNAAAAARHFYRRLSAYLLGERVSAGHEADPFCVISVNWDCVLEQALYWCLEQAELLGKADVDYCCYTTPLSPDSHHTPSLHQKVLGLYNVKIIKLHGSANWLLCPNCNRLYTGLGSEDDDLPTYLFPRPCPTCDRIVGGATDGGPQLEPFMVAPTYLKVFDNPHIKMAWHNAHMDLAEACHVVFIGYSLPEADYHVRTLLRRTIDPDARISVVLTERDEPKDYIPQYLHGCFPAERYAEFFGANRIEVELGGVEERFSPIVPDGDLGAELVRIRDLVCERGQ